MFGWPAEKVGMKLVMKWEKEKNEVGRAPWVSSNWASGVAKR